jgi:hypothetical protein
MTPQGKRAQCPSTATRGTIAGTTIKQRDFTIATTDKGAMQEQPDSAAFRVMRASVFVELLSNQKHAKHISRGLEADLPYGL